MIGKEKSYDFHGFPRKRRESGLHPVDGQVVLAFTVLPVGRSSRQMGTGADPFLCSRPPVIELDVSKDPWGCNNQFIGWNRDLVILG